jgi:transposase
VKKYTEEFKQKIIHLYNLGNTINYLSMAYGVASITIYKWINESTSANAQKQQPIKSGECQTKGF